MNVYITILKGRILQHGPIRTTRICAVGQFRRGRWRTTKVEKPYCLCLTSDKKHVKHAPAQGEALLAAEPELSIQHLGVLTDDQARYVLQLLRERESSIAEVAEAAAVLA